jgi:hypothetical protein
MRGVIYTAIAARKDVLAAPAHRIAGVDYVCFTDDATIHSAFWTMRPLSWWHSDPARVAKRPKILPHRELCEYDWSLWIDGNIHIKADIEPFITQHLNRGDFFAFQHPDRSNIYEEADACIRLAKDDPGLITAQIQYYRRSGIPDDLGLTANFILLRRHSNANCVVMELWWDEINRWSKRDQISLPFALWKTAGSIDYFSAAPPWPESNSFKRVPHAAAASANAPMERLAGVAVCAEAYPCPAHEASFRGAAGTFGKSKRTDRE